MHSFDGVFIVNVDEFFSVSDWMTSDMRLLTLILCWSIDWIESIDQKQSLVYVMA